MLLVRTNNPLVPAKAGTQGGKLRPSNKWLWIPACAGMSGMFRSCLVSSQLDQCIGDPHAMASGTDEYRIEVDRRMTLSQQVEANVRGHFGELVFGTTIPRNVRIAEAPSHGMPVLIYDNACAGAQAYILLASEFIRRRRAAAESLPEQVSHEPVS